MPKSKKFLLLPLTFSLLHSCIGASIAASPTAILQDWQFDPNQLQLQITLNQPIRPQYFVLTQPPRIVVDLPNTKLGNIPNQQNYPGAVQKIRISQFQPGVTRIVLDLATGVVLNPNQIELLPTASPNRTGWLLRPIIAGASNLLQTADLQPQTTVLPPAIWNSQMETTVSVPPLNRSSSTPAAANTLPPALFTPQPDSIVTVPPLGTTGVSVPILPPQPTQTQVVPTSRTPQPSTTPVDVVEFGQPLPQDEKL